METPDVLKLIYERRFFDRLEEALAEASAEPVIRWLDLLTTEAVQDWAMSSRSLKKVLSGRRRDGQAALALLLKRQLLQLGARRDPRPLCDFCDWANIAPLNSVWERLPETLEPASITDQERLFSERLSTALSDAQKQLVPEHWATRELDRIVASRRDPATVPTARIVFAFTYRPVPELRPGLLVDFSLHGLAESSPILAHPEIFDDSFLEALERIGSAIGDTQRRRLEHNCNVPINSLCGASGAMALMLAHRLAATGDHFDRRPWALPPWIVISSELDKSRPDAPAAPVEYTSEKAAVLVEEGVRLFLIAEGSNLPIGEVEDFHIQTFNENAFDLAKRLFAQRQLLKGDFDAFATQLVTAHPDARERVQRFRERHSARSDDSDLKITPTFAFQRILDGLSQLDGRGFLQVTAPSGYGKSETVKSLVRGEHRNGPCELIGKTIAFHVFRGEATHPKEFLDYISNRAVGLDETGFLYIDRAKGDPHTPAVRCRIRELLAETQDAVCRHGERLLLILDGIDELDEVTGPLLLDILPTADELPAGCFVLLFSQHECPKQIEESLEQIRRNAGPDMYQRLELFPNNPQYQLLLREYASERLGDGCENILPAMVSSTTSFRHFDLLCQWLEMLRERGVDWNNLESSELPETDELFTRYLYELRHSIGADHFDAWERRILIMIGAAYEPIDRECLAYWLRGLSENPIDVEHHVDLAIDRLRPLLCVERREWLQNRTQFVLADPQFEEWLLTNETPDWGDDAYIECISRIAEEGRRLFSRGADLARVRDANALHLLHYHFWYLPTLMLEIGDNESAYRFLTAPWHDEVFDTFSRGWRTQVFGSQQLAFAKRRTSDFATLLKEFSKELEKDIGEEETYPFEEMATCVQGAATSLLKMVEASVRAGRLEDAAKTLLMLEEMLNAAAFFDGEETFQVRLMMDQEAKSRLRYFYLVAETMLATAEIALLRRDEERAYRHLNRAFALMMTSTRIVKEEECGAMYLVRALIIWSKVSRMQTELFPRTDRWAQSALCSLHLAQAIEGVIENEGGLEAASEVDDRLGSLLSGAMHDRARLLLIYWQAKDEIDKQLNEGQLASIFAHADEIESAVNQAILLCGRALELLTPHATNNAERAQVLMTRGKCLCVEGDIDGFQRDYREAIGLFQRAAVTDSVSHFCDLLACYRDTALVLGPYAKNDGGLPILLEATIVIRALLEQLKDLPDPQDLRGSQQIVELTTWLDETLCESGLTRALATDQVAEWGETKKMILKMSGVEI